MKKLYIRIYIYIMSSSIIDFVNCHTEKENGDNKYINDKFLDVKELNSEDMYVSKSLNLKGVVPANSVLGTDANFNIVRSITSVSTPAYYSYNNGIGLTSIGAGSGPAFQFGVGGTTLQQTPNITYTLGLLQIFDDGIYLFNFSALVSVDAIASSGSFTLTFTNYAVNDRIFNIGQTYGFSNVNDRQLICGSFITSCRGVFPEWRLTTLNQYTISNVSLRNMNTSIYKISNLP